MYTEYYTINTHIPILVGVYNSKQQHLINPNHLHNDSHIYHHVWKVGVICYLIIIKKKKLQCKSWTMPDLQPSAILTKIYFMSWWYIVGGIMHTP